MVWSFLYKTSLTLSDLLWKDKEGKFGELGQKDFQGTTHLPDIINYTQVECWTSIDHNRRSVTLWQEKLPSRPADLLLLDTVHCKNLGSMFSRLLTHEGGQPITRQQLIQKWRRDFMIAISGVNSLSWRWYLCYFYIVGTCWDRLAGSVHTDLQKLSGQRHHKKVDFHRFLALFRGKSSVNEKLANLTYYWSLLRMKMWKGMLNN